MFRERSLCLLVSYMKFLENCLLVQYICTPLGSSDLMLSVVSQSFGSLVYQKMSFLHFLL